MSELNAMPLWNWMTERHAIYLRRHDRHAKWPWTQDKILQEYRFCNVFRELDTVTQWIHEHIRVPYAEHPNLWMMLAIARQINHPPTLAAILHDDQARYAWPHLPDVWDERSQERVAEIMDARKARGEQVYTGAYMIRAESDPKKEWFSWSKQRYVARIVLGKVWERRNEFNDLFANGQPSLRDVHEWLMQFHGWGGFMAYEVVTDLRHTRYLRNAPDIMTWANAGPGALRGLNRLFGRPLKSPLKQSQARDEMRHLLNISRHFLPHHLPRLELRDIEHSLCETDKYLRVLNGEGKPRSKYRRPT